MIGLGLVVATAFGSVACGSGAGEGAAGTAAGSASSVSATMADDTPPAERASSPLPTIDVTDVTTGEPVDLAGLLPADQPVLVWMWAPH